MVNGTDEMYCVYLGRALQTVNAPDGSISNLQVAPTIITGQTAETSIATDDTILIHDTSASALRKMTRANFVSGIGGTNTPSFLAYASTNQTFSSATSTRVALDTEVFDASNVFTNTSGNYKFTVPSGEAGKYLFYFQIRKNNLSGSRFRAEVIRTRSSAESAVLAAEEGGSGDSYATAGSVSIIDVQVADTYHVTAYHNDSGDRTLLGNIYSTFFGAYKIIE